MVSDTQQIPTIRRSRRFEFVVANLASFLTGGLIVACIAVSYELTPLPAMLDLTRAAALGLVVLAVVAALVRQATVVVLRGQREVLAELRRELALARGRAVVKPSPFDDDVKAAVADIASYMDRR